MRMEELDTLENGKKESDVERERCAGLIVKSTMANGRTTYAAGLDRLYRKKAGIWYDED